MIALSFLWGGLVGFLIEHLSNWLPRKRRELAPILAPRELTILRATATAVTALFFTYTAVRYGSGWQGAMILLTYSYFLLVAFIDLKYHIVPNFLVYPATGLVLLFHIGFSTRPIVLTVAGGVLAFAVFYLTALLRAGDLGGGDIKLATLIGLAFGFPGAMWALLIGAFAGGLTIFFLRILSGSAQRHWPYAPFLCLGAIITALYNPTDMFLPLLR